MNELLNDLANRAGIRWFDYQLEAFDKAELDANQRRCLYYRTGAGKSLTSLAMMRLWNQADVLVITPPATFPEWEKTAAKLGMSVECMSHAKFRDPATKLDRRKAVIGDEVHLFGGHNGKGWKRLDALGRRLEAPLIVASATPNYNDVERVYCIQHVLAPQTVKGGYLEFIYQHCETEQNPFGREPKVTGFRNFADAEEYLAALPYVDYLPDELEYSINNIVLPRRLDPSFSELGWNPRRQRVMASDIEARHAVVDLSLVDDHGYLRRSVYTALDQVVSVATTPVLVFANHSTVADALVARLVQDNVSHEYINGKTSTKRKAEKLVAFKGGGLDILVGTASLATGTDGLDKMCDWLVILDDTDDDALRRQLIGRIMPRGADSDASKKQVYRMVLA